MDITLYLFLMAFLMGLAAWCVFLWAIRTGQFRDVEKIKYQIVSLPKGDEASPPAKT
ncbi:MAG: cbb3-type cytochrome oxidase assembly protein CcoS [Thermoanaerobaculia bacterium]